MSERKKVYDTQTATNTDHGLKPHQKCINDGVTDEQCEIADEQILFTAILCHQVNRAYCQGIGDNSQPEWDDAPEWARDSAINGVIFHVCNPEAGASASHESWMAQKLEEGWKYGPVKNPEKKEHPCIVPFTDLPVEQQAKDYIFRAIVHTMLG